MEHGASNTSASIADFNRRYWEKQVAAEYYSHATQLQPAEETVLRTLGPELSGMTMLDIGVGAGRTTAHFAPRVAKYVGIDYSAAMIFTCRERFRTKFPEAKFAVCDATSLTAFGDDEFDFVLFSFNGLDSVSHEDRLRIIKETHRVSRPGALFCFSTHNLNIAPSITGLSGIFSGGVKRLAANTAHWFRLVFVHNSPADVWRARRAEYAVLNDGAHNYSLKQYYIRPQAQVAQLQPYFDNIQVFTRGGQEATPAECASLRDWWLYFLCRCSKKTASADYRDSRQTAGGL